MKPSLLPWLGDQKFIPLVEEVLMSGLEAITTADKKLENNIIDPFLMLFEMGSFNLDSRHWIVNEKARQAQKTLSNHIGLFHQKLIGSLDGWENLGTREIMDVVNHEKRIIAEIKNKYNTVKQSDLIGLYHDMERAVSKVKCNSLGEFLDFPGHDFIGSFPVHGLSRSAVHQAGNVVEHGLANL